MDNLNTHRPGALYETFEPAEAKALWDRFEFVYTPKHGSWLNVAEVELNVMIRQCLNRRIDSIDTLRAEVAAWQAASSCRDTASYFSERHPWSSAPSSASMQKALSMVFESRHDNTSRLAQSITAPRADRSSSTLTLAARASGSARKLPRKEADHCV